MNKTSVPKVFISYSWKPSDNKEKTILLAKRLVENGVDVIIDVWNLKEGQDKYIFMEQMVNSDDINRVLIVCNQAYCEKANSRMGGVGSESMIISDEIYNDTEQTKFIPIIHEKSEDGKPFLPTYISSRIYIDLSDEEYFEEEFEKLLRNLFEKPSFEKPALGIPPPYIRDESKLSINIGKINSIKSALIHEKQYSSELILEYFDLFIETLRQSDIDISNLTIEIDEIVIQKIDLLEPIKNELLDLIKLIIRYSKGQLLLIHKFFEKFFSFIVSNEDPNVPANTLGAMKNDHYYFIGYELYLSISCLLIEKELYHELASILHSPYTIYSPHKKDYISLTFVNASVTPSSLNSYRIQRLSKNNINEVSHLIRNRAKKTAINENFISEVDAILYYISCLTAQHADRSRIWFPHTCDSSRIEIPLIKKLKSQNTFSHFMPLFNVGSKEEFFERLEYVKQMNIDKKIQRYYYGLDPIEYVFKSDEVASMP